MIKLLSLPEAAEFLGIHPSTVSRKVKNQEIEHYKIGSRLKFSEAALLDYLERCKVEAKIEK